MRDMVGAQFDFFDVFIDFVMSLQKRTHNKYTIFSIFKNAVRNAAFRLACEIVIFAALCVIFFKTILKTPRVYLYSADTL